MADLDTATPHRSTGGVALEDVSETFTVTRDDTHCARVRWAIPKFSSLTTKATRCLWSKYFEVGGYDCRVLVYPAGKLPAPSSRPHCEQLIDHAQTRLSASECSRYLQDSLSTSTAGQRRSSKQAAACRGFPGGQGVCLHLRAGHRSQERPKVGLLRRSPAQHHASHRRGQGPVPGLLAPLLSEEEVARVV